MSPYRRNVMVGAVVLGAIVILAWMILKFAGSAMAPFAPTRMPVHFISARGDGLSDGAAVTYRGVAVGQVGHVSRTDDDQVRINAQIDSLPPLPGNLKGIIRSNGVLGGGSAIALVLTDGKPQGQLKKDQEISATYVGLDILPPEFAELAGELRLTAKQFRESNVVAHMDEQILHLGKVIDSIQAVIDDPKMREDLRISVKNLRETTEKASQLSGNLDKLTNETRGHFDDLSKNIGDRLVQLAGVLDQLQQVTGKINEGKGTAGQLINDPKLYESLVDTTRDLNETIKDLKRLVKQWEQEGVSLKMGK